MWVGTVPQIIVNQGADCSPKTQARDLKGPLTLSTDRPPPHQKDDMDSILLTETGDTKGPGRGTQAGESQTPPGSIISFFILLLPFFFFCSMGQVLNKQSTPYLLNGLSGSVYEILMTDANTMAMKVEIPNRILLGGKPKRSISQVLSWAFDELA